MQSLEVARGAWIPGDGGIVREGRAAEIASDHKPQAASIWQREL